MRDLLTEVGNVTRRETTRFLSELLRNKLQGKYFASEVTFNWGRQGEFRLDFMAFAPRNQTVAGIEAGTVTAYEIKSCIEDYRSPNGHNLHFDKNYYVMPMAARNVMIREKPYQIGIYVPHRIDVSLMDEWENPTDFSELEYGSMRFSEWTLSCKDKAYLKDRDIPIATCLFNMMRSG